MSTKGRKDDQQKARWDLLPLISITEIVKVLTYGATKYADNNWQHVKQPQPRYYAALMRHLAAWKTGESTDSESGLMHLAHAACCCIFLIWFELQSKPVEKE